MTYVWKRKTFHPLMTMKVPTAKERSAEEPVVRFCRPAEDFSIHWCSRDPSSSIRRSNAI